VSAIAPIYCPQGTQSWITNVMAFMTTLGANPDDTRWQGATSDAPSALQAAAPTPAPSGSPKPAVLVLERPISMHPSAAITAGQSLQVTFTLTNAGGTPGSWGAVSLQLQDPSGQTVSYGSSAPLTLAAGGSYSFTAPLSLTTPGTWRGWVEVGTTNGSVLSESQPAFQVSVEEPVAATQPAQRNAAPVIPSDLGPQIGEAQ
jgi:hypothetical protein